MRKFFTRFPISLSLVCIAAFFSGAAGLVYEITWSKMLVVVLGSSAEATGVVLASFMLGIALGARWLGERADSAKRPLRFYALLELGLGLYALLMPFWIEKAASLPLFVHGWSSWVPPTLLRAEFAGLVILLPSVAMGATLPILVRALVNHCGWTKGLVGLVYGINTLGAALGAAAAGFVLLPTFGIFFTSLVGVVASVSAACLAWVVNRSEVEAEDGIVAQEQRAAIAAALARRDDRGGPDRRLALFAAAISGFVILGAEVVWSRILTFVFGHDTYAFAVLLVVVLVGLGLGGMLQKKLAARNPRLLVGALLGLMGLALLDSFWVAAAVIVKFGRDPFGLGQFGAFADSLLLEFFRELAFTPVLVLIPALLAGAAFPAAVTMYTGTAERFGRRVGTAMLANGIGCAAGALLVTFAAIETIGLQGTFVALAAIAAGASILVLFWGVRPRPQWRQLALGALPVAATLLIALLMPRALPQQMLAEAVGANHQNIVHYEEGRTGTVSVTVNRISGEKQLFMNAVNEVTTRLVHDQSFKLLGHLGPLLHPQPRRGLMICFGAGLSAGAALAHPFESLDVVELSSSIPRAADHWATENNHALNDPRLHLHIDDGRHYLAVANTQYDVVMVDSTHPKALDSWTLYTKEFYLTVREHLGDDGIFVQWVPLHGLSEREMRIIVRTFNLVFPNTTLWVNVGFEEYGQAAYIKMVGTLNPLKIDYRQLAARLQTPRIHTDLAPFGMGEPAEILDMFLAGPAAVMRWTMGAAIQTDDHPIVPYITDYSNGRRMTASLLLGVRSSVTPLLHHLGPEEKAILGNLAKAVEAQGFLLAENLDRAEAAWPAGKKSKLFKAAAAKGRGYYQSLARLYDGNPGKLFEIGSYLGNLGFSDDAEILFDQALRLRPDDRAIGLNLALTKLDLGDGEGALAMLSALAARDEGDALAQYNLGVVYNSLHQSALAVSHLRRVRASAPNLIGARLALAQALLETKDLNGARGELDSLIAFNPWVAEAWDLQGQIYAQQRRWEDAKGYYTRALELEPYRADSHYNLGIVLEELGQHRAAFAAYSSALKIDPTHAQAHNNLGLVAAAFGLKDLAISSHLAALTNDPQYAEAAYNLGLAYRANGQVADALRAFQLALRLNPSLQQVSDRIAELTAGGAGVNTDPAGADAADAGAPSAVLPQ